MMHNLNRQVLDPQDTMSLQTHAPRLKWQWWSSTKAQQLVGFFALYDRPKHDSQWPQVGQTFKKPRHGSHFGKVQLLKPVGLAA
jgi:hypothetical protein